ncbi:MAG: hypothetical protein GXX96_17620 [Planctomycetaceae bacterium]|jgi:hypothetical protein|nr:hypothetical protein [Planctomycetaceae bacterium]
MKRRVSNGLAIAVLCLASCQKQTEPLPQEDWPKTLEEATARLIADMSDDDKQTVRSTKKEDLIEFHFGWGTGIRNSFGLWQGNDALLKSCDKKHPDDASMVIIESVWKRLNEQAGSEETPSTAQPVLTP